MAVAAGGARCEAILTALARFHAAWWDDPRLGVSVGTWFDEAAMEQRRQQSAELIARFADRLGEDLSSGRRDLYDRLIRSTPRLHRRYHAHRNMTIGHGDAHVWNFFLPRDGGADVRLFDWDSWRINLPTNDPAYMMAVHWYPDRRQRLETPLLAFYHTVLQENGVSGYNQSDLFDDYRLSVLWQMLTPVWQAAANIPPMVWWSHLQRVMAAVDDLGCRALLD